MSSRESSGSPGPHSQPKEDRTWQAAACQCTRQGSQLRENDSRRTVRPADGKRFDGGHHGGEHRGSGGRRGDRHHRVQDCADRAARCTGAALLLDGVTALHRRCRFRRSRVAVVRLGCRLMVRVNAGSTAVMVGAFGCHGLRGFCGSRFAVVVWTAIDHGCGSSTLRGDCQHHQPDQKRSEQQAHAATLQQLALEGTAARTRWLVTAVASGLEVG